VRNCLGFFLLFPGVFACIFLRSLHGIERNAVLIPGQVWAIQPGFFFCTFEVTRGTGSNFLLRSCLFPASETLKASQYLLPSCRVQRFLSRGIFLPGQTRVLSSATENFPSRSRNTSLFSSFFFFLIFLRGLGFALFVMPRLAQFFFFSFSNQLNVNNREKSWRISGFSAHTLPPAPFSFLWSVPRVTPQIRRPACSPFSLFSIDTLSVRCFFRSERGPSYQLFPPGQQAAEFSSFSADRNSSRWLFPKAGKHIFFSPLRLWLLRDTLL